LILILGSVLFALQIYCDFSGYSDIALGVARLFGIDLLRNFAFPYFSRDIAEFWRRWHISLTTWFRDYLYIPLGGSKVNTWNKIRNTFIVFLVSGFWHGANWTFIVWGILNAIYFMPLMILGKNRQNIEIAGHGRMLPTIKEFFQIIITFIFVCFAWIFFRAVDLSHAAGYITSMFSNDFMPPKFGPINYTLAGFIVILLSFEWIYRDRKFGFDISNLHIVFRWVMYLFLVCILFIYNDNEETGNFIYFQF
jgi:alginate O-acetyltransferase complex protein AlgI